MKQTATITLCLPACLILIDIFTAREEIRCFENKLITETVEQWRRVDNEEFPVFFNKMKSRKLREAGKVPRMGSHDI